MLPRVRGADTTPLGASDIEKGPEANDCVAVNTQVIPIITNGVNPPELLLFVPICRELACCTTHVLRCELSVREICCFQRGRLCC